MYKLHSKTLLTLIRLGIIFRLVWVHKAGHNLQASLGLRLGIIFRLVWVYKAGTNILAFLGL
jgi:hypothetical protein